MKKKKLITGLLTLAVFAMTACGSSDNTSGSAASGSAQTDSGAAGEKTFVYGTTAYGEAMGTAGLNPHSDYSGWSTVRYGVGETLFKFNDSMEAEPWLAEGYEFIDDNTVQIKLRDDVNFSNGRKLDAEAVKECLEDLIEVHDRAPYDMMIDEITADGQTVTINTAEPCPALINYLSDPYAAIIDMQAGISGEGGSASVIGTGPYIAESVSPTEISLVKNENYWGGDVKTDRVIVRTFDDAASLTAALQTGDIQGTYGLQYDNYALFSDESSYTINSVPTSRCFLGQFNFDSELMRDDAVRQAVEMGIDKDGFCNVITEGRCVPAASAFPDSFSFGNSAVNAKSYDPEAARTLLENDGWTDTDGDGIREKNGEKLSISWLTYPGRLELPKLAEYAQSTLKDIGIDVSVNNTADSGSYAKSGDFDVYVSSVTSAPTGDPEYFFKSYVTGSKNFGDYYNAEAADMINTLHTTFDNEERGELAVKIQQQMLDDDAYFFVAHLNMGIITKKNVTGIAAHPCDYYEITADLSVE